MHTRRVGGNVDPVSQSTDDIRVVTCFGQFMEQRVYSFLAHFGRFAGPHDGNILRVGGIQNPLIK